MAVPNLNESLAKVLIAEAWADGQLAPEEIDNLKDVLFRYCGIFRDERDGVPALEWAKIEMYIDSPVSAAERAVLIKELQASMLTPEDKELALAALEEMVSADGVITDDEQAVLDQITSAIESQDYGILGRTSRLVHGALTRRSEALSGGSTREKYFPEYLANRVYYGVRFRLDQGKAQLDIPDTKLRLLSAAAGLMAKVACVDEQTTAEEMEFIKDILQSQWNVKSDVADFVTRVAIEEVDPDIDDLRLTREFVSLTSARDRVRFIDLLFSIANVDGFVSTEEIDEIRRIGRNFMLSSQTIYEAKMKIPRERRAS